MNMAEQVGVNITLFEPFKMQTEDVSSFFYGFAIGLGIGACLFVTCGEVQQKLNWRTILASMKRCACFLWNKLRNLKPKKPALEDIRKNHLRRRKRRLLAKCRTLETIPEEGSDISD